MSQDSTQMPVSGKQDIISSWTSIAVFVSRHATGIKRLKGVTYGNWNTPQAFEARSECLVTLCLSEVNRNVEGSWRVT